MPRCDSSVRVPRDSVLLSDDEATTDDRDRRVEDSQLRTLEMLEREAFGYFATNALCVIL